MQQGSLARVIGLIPSSVMIGIFFVVPFVLILLTSFSVETSTGDYRLGFSLAHFERFATWFYIERALFSAGLCALIAMISLLIAYPFTYFLTMFSPRVQTLWLIYILA